MGLFCDAALAERIERREAARVVAGAADEGCDVATVTTSPATKSQQNAQRQGFELLYTRVVLAKGADGSR